MRQALLLFLWLSAFGAAAAPVANFSATPLNGCPPMVVSFTDLSTGSPTTWLWNFGNSTTSAAQNPTISYLAPGNYTVSLTVSNASGSNTKTMTAYITVKQPPSVTFTASPLALCPGVPVSFTSGVTWNATGSGTYNWDFGDGGSSSSANPTHAYTTGGLYTVKLTATNSVGCPTTDTMPNLITVYNKPAVSFSASDTVVCSLGGVITFTSLTSSGTTPYSYLWDFGDGTTSTSGSPATHNYYTLGFYTVKLYVTDANGCSDSLRRTNLIHVNHVIAAATVPTSGCDNTGIPMSSAGGTSSGAAIVWDFGDGSGTRTGPTQNHYYTAAGTYNVKMFATIGGCTDTAINTIVINARPAVAFTVSPAAPCPAPSVVTFTNTTPGSGTYFWDFGDGFTSTLTSPIHTYTINFPGLPDTVKLTATNAAGCSATIFQTFRIYPGDLRIKDTPISGCYPVAINFSNTLTYTLPFIGPINYPYARTSYLWTFGDGFSSTAASPVHTYTAIGTYTARLTVTTSNGCTFMDTVVVHVGTHSMPNFGVSQRSTCARSGIAFYDSTISPSGPITAWLWDFGDQTYSTTQNPIQVYTVPGTYTVTLTTSMNGCDDTVKKQLYITVYPPNAAPKFKVSCDTFALVHFADSSVGATSRIWRFGDGTSSTAVNPDHQYSTGGTYTGSLATYNNASGCRDSVTFTVIINNLVVNIYADDSTICPHDTVRLSSAITGGGSSTLAFITEYVWWRGSGTAMPGYIVPMPPTPPDSAGKVYAFPVRGQYHIALRVTDLNGCRFSTIKNNFITVGGPLPGFKATPPFGCAPATIVLTDTTNYVPSTYAVSRYWDFGDGTNTTTTASSISHGYPNTGSYSIILRVTDNIGCTDSLGISNFLLISRPTAFFSTLSNNACIGQPFSFFSSSTGNAITHSWSFGDGGTSTASSPTHTYATAGTYTVRLIVTDNVGCKDTMTKVGGVTVNAIPHAAFTMSDTLAVCPPLIVNFTNTSSASAATYNWSFGNNTFSTLTNPSATYAAPGIYNIRLIAKNASGCPDTAYGRVRVLGYAGVLSYSPLSGCAPFRVTFTANNVDGVPGFIYDFDDGTTAASTNKTISHVYTQPGPHVPRITLTDNLGCSVVSSGIDTIKVDGVIAGFTFSPFPACDKGTIQFIDTSRGAYSALIPPAWRFHDGTTSSLATPQKTYAGPGTYSVILYSATVAGCKDTFRSSVTFYPLPTIDAGPDTLICVTDSAILRPKGGVSYNWSPAATLSCAACTNPAAFPAVQTRYTVVGKDAHGCTNTDTVTVRIRTKTTTTVSPGTEICAGESVTLTATGASIYQWIPPTGLNDPTSSSPQASPNTTQHYIVISRLARCIPDTDYVDLIVHPTPVVDAGKDQTMIAGNTVQLQAVGSGFITGWAWAPPDGLSCGNCSAPEAGPKRTTVYRVTASTEFGCTATDTVRITVLCDNNQVFLPNTFTPDGNGVNDVFYPHGKGLEIISHFRIYDRWGEIVFQRDNIRVGDIQQGWDGRKAGRLLSPDIYVYTVEAICDTGDPIHWQGDVMLLR